MPPLITGAWAKVASCHFRLRGGRRTLLGARKICGLGPILVPLLLPEYKRRASYWLDIFGFHRSLFPQRLRPSVWQAHYRHRGIRKTLLNLSFKFSNSFGRNFCWKQFANGHPAFFFLGWRRNKRLSKLRASERASAALIVESTKDEAARRGVSTLSVHSNISN